MQQYLELLKTIQEKGTYKPAARAGMPGTQSLFGYQFRHNLADGFPLLTTKKMFWKGVVVELLWFLRGDTNIKYLIDNGVNIWNEDAYNYYNKICSNHSIIPMDFKDFIEAIKEEKRSTINDVSGYKLGDCGFQYGKVWRSWKGEKLGQWLEGDVVYNNIDQIANVINSLKNNPESRRHIVTAIDPANDDDLALYWCHALFQFNCRPLTIKERIDLYMKSPNADPTDFGYNGYESEEEFEKRAEKFVDGEDIPKYFLDCQLYQRSADVVLGVPFNIASYALLTHIIAKICNMVPGEFVHTFGDVHIYDNHREAVEEQLKRTPDKLPTLKMSDRVSLWEGIYPTNLDLSFDAFTPDDFVIEDYNPQPAIKAELSTGLKK